MAEGGNIGYRLQRVGDTVVMTFVNSETGRFVELLWTLEATAILAAQLGRIAQGPADALDAELAQLIAQQPEGGA